MGSRQFLGAVCLGVLLLLGCSHSQEMCRPGCQPEMEEKKIVVHCYAAKHEEFCVPQPSKRGERHCKQVCDSCESEGDIQVTGKATQRVVWFDWKPRGARTFTRTRLMRKTETVNVPSPEWSVAK